VTDPNPAADLALSDETDSEEAVPDGASTLAALVAEHRSERLGPLWLAEIHAACASKARRYPPSVYGRAAAWDSTTIEDLVMDTVERLLMKSQVEYICDTAGDLAHARALLHRQVRHTLLDRRTRTVVDNLLDRAVDLLRADPYQADDTPPPGWIRSGTTPERASATLPVRMLGLRLRRLPRLPADGVERASPVWTSETLSLALDDVVTTLGKVTRDNLEKIFNDALTSLAPSEFVSDEAGSAQTDLTPGPEELAVARDAVRRLTDQLDPVETAVLSFKFQGMADAEAASALGISRPTVDSRKKAATAKVRDALISLDTTTQNAALHLLQQQILPPNQGTGS
jgi:DNA-directed RNA polymerase specialized sigma24 family protein